MLDGWLRYPAAGRGNGRGLRKCRIDFAGLLFSRMLRGVAGPGSAQLLPVLRQPCEFSTRGPGLERERAVGLRSRGASGFHH